MKTRAEKLAIYGKTTPTNNHASHSGTWAHPRKKEFKDDNSEEGIPPHAHHQARFSDYDKQDDSEFEVTVEFTFSDNRRRDLENCVSTVLDALVTCRRLLAEDSAIENYREEMRAQFRRLHNHDSPPDAGKAAS